MTDAYEAEILKLRREVDRMNRQLQGNRQSFAPLFNSTPGGRARQLPVPDDDRRGPYRPTSYGGLTTAPRGRRHHSVPTGGIFASPEAEIDHLRSELRQREHEATKLRRNRRDSLHLKIPTYNGETDFDEYLDQFVGIVEFQDWDDEEAAIILWRLHWTIRRLGR